MTFCSLFYYIELQNVIFEFMHFFSFHDAMFSIDTALFYTQLAFFASSQRSF